MTENRSNKVVYNPLGSVETDNAQVIYALLRECTVGVNNRDQRCVSQSQSLSQSPAALSCSGRDVTVSSQLTQLHQIERAS